MDVRYDFAINGPAARRTTRNRSLKPILSTRRKCMKRSTLLAALLSVALPTMAFAQTADDLKNDEKTTGDVLVYGMGYSGNRYSPLTQINKQNVSKLVPVWGYSLADLQGGEGFP